MTDTSELVKQLLRESRHHTDVKAEAAKAIKRLEREFADFNRLALKHRRELKQQLADENTAQAIERLERERERLEENRTQLIKNCDDWSAKWQAAEQQLADARAEIERKDKALDLVIKQAEVYKRDKAEHNRARWSYIQDICDKALATPAPSTGEAELEAKWRDAMERGDFKMVNGLPFPKRPVTVQGPNGRITVGGKIDWPPQQEQEG